VQGCLSPPFFLSKKRKKTKTNVGPNAGGLVNRISRMKGGTFESRTRGTGKADAQGKTDGWIDGLKEVKRDVSASRAVLGLAYSTRVVSMCMITRVPVEPRRGEEERGGYGRVTDEPIVTGEIVFPLASGAPGE